MKRGSAKRNFKDRVIQTLELYKEFVKKIFKDEMIYTQSIWWTDV